VKVRIRPVLFNVGLMGQTVTYSGGRWPIPDQSYGAAFKRPDPGEVIELAEIVIENAGRHPTTVYEIGFRWLGNRKHWRKRRIRHSAVPTAIHPPGQEGRVFAAGDEFRIEPSDVVTVLVDYWGLVRSHRPSGSGTIGLRGAVRVAGRRRLKLSPRKSQWQIPDSAATSTGTATTLPARAVIARAVGLAVLHSGQSTVGDIYLLARSLEAALEGVWLEDWKSNHDRLRQFVKDSPEHFLLYKDGMGMEFTLMFSLHRELDAQKDVIDWADIAQPGLHKMLSSKAGLTMSSPNLDYESPDSSKEMNTAAEPDSN